MVRAPVVLGCVLLFALGDKACEPSDPGDSQTSADARVQTRDAGRDASDDAPDTGSDDVEDASSGGRKDASTALDARADAECPPECFRPYTCATSCGAPAFNNGCCPCPAGTVDTITCNTQGGGGAEYCAVPCTGAAPDPSVVAACQEITSQSACQAYQASAFPYGCRWVTPATAQCPPLP